VNSFFQLKIFQLKSVRFKNATLNVSTGSYEHAEYFLSLRPGARIIKFEVPQWFDNLIKEHAIPQNRASANPVNNGLAPKIVDPTTPGNSYELPPIWSEWLNENVIQGSGVVKKGP
jgi:filamentous hemagglutinin